jgi:hypothetical protein
MGERRGAYRVMLGKPEGKGPTLKTDVDGKSLKYLQQTAWGRGLDYLAQVRHK